MKKNIVLIGYRATGKTTIGKLLAQRLNWNFIDTDILIEQRARQSISQIVAERGWEYFRELESKIIQGTSHLSNHIIAVGGGAILKKENVETLKKTGFLIWLKASPNVIAKRLLKDGKTLSMRPSLTGKMPQDEIEEVLMARLPAYKEAADLEINTEYSAPEQIVIKIINLLTKQLKIID